MGQFKKKHYEALDDEVYDFNTTELLCANHIEDEFIKNFILRNGTASKCTYCHKKRNVVELSTVLELIVTGIECLFEDANDSRFLNKEGRHGFDGNTMEFDEIYSELGLVINDNKLSDDIFEHLNNCKIIYCERDEFGGYLDYLSGLWNYFKEIVKHKARFVFHYENTFSNFFYENPYQILLSVQETISEFNMFRTISKEDRLYRCVQHISQYEVDNDGKRIASNPIYNCKSNNRMSPAGISMFYCSPYMETSISEVVDLKNSDCPFYTYAYFTAKSNLKLVDLTKLPALPSIFDKIKNNQIETLSFLKEFIIDLSKPIGSGDVIIDYIPTQIVTEYIRYNPKLEVDGIIYPSSKDGKKENYVLFKDHDQSLKDLVFHNESKTTCKIELDNYQ